MTHDEWGNVLTDTVSGYIPFGFAGGLYDNETVLTRFGVREYDASIGRWIAPDPIGFAGGLNFYVYNNNDPINRIDPAGLGPDQMDPWQKFLHSLIMQSLAVPASLIGGTGELFGYDNWLWDFAMENNGWAMIQSANAPDWAYWAYGGSLGVTDVFSGAALVVGLAGGGASATSIQFANLPLGIKGSTAADGSILIQRGLSGQALRQTLRHELVHRFFTPRSGPFLGLRQALGM